MTQFVFDDEQYYEIGSEWFYHQIESSKTTRDLLTKSTKKPILKFRRCWQYSWKDCKATLICGDIKQHSDG